MTPWGSAGSLPSNEPQPDAGGVKFFANAGTVAPVAPEPLPLPSPLLLAPQPVAEAPASTSAAVQPKTFIALLQLVPRAERRSTKNPKSSSCSYFLGSGVLLRYSRRMARSTSVAPVDNELRPPQQSRSRASLDRVLQAGQELLIEKGFDGFTVQEVSKRAKVSIGSIYARAPSKEALVFAVYDYAVAELRDERQAFDDPTRWEGLSFDALVRAAVRECAETMFRHEDVLRIIMTRAAIDQGVRERGAHQIYDVARQWEEVVLARRDEIVHPDPELAVEIAFRMFYATLVRRISFGSDFGAYMTIDGDETLIEEMGAAVTAYLTAPSAVAAKPKPAARKPARRRAKAA